MESRVYRLTCELDVPYDLYYVLSEIADQTGRTISELWAEALNASIVLPAPEDLRSQLQMIYHLPG